MNRIHPDEPLLGLQFDNSNLRKEGTPKDPSESDPFSQQNLSLENIRNLPPWKRVFRALQKGSMRGVVVIFIRLCLGAGIFTLPFYVKSYGYVLGALMILLAGILSLLSYYDILEAADESNADNFFSLIRRYLGERVFQVFKVTYFFDLSASVIGVFVVCYKLLQFCLAFLGLVRPEWIGNPDTGEWDEHHPQVLQVRFIFFVALLAISVPFLLQRELYNLQKVNLLVLLALILLIGYIVGECPFFYAAYQDQTSREAFRPFNTSMFENFFALLLSFYAQPFVFTLRSELAEPTVARLKKVTRIAMGLEVMIFVVAGVAGYLALGDKFTPEMLYARVAYPGKNLLSEWVYRGILLFYFGCVLLGLAVYNPTIRQSLFDLFPTQAENPTLYPVFSLAPFLLFAIVAFAKPSVVFIFNLTGLTVSNLNGFILPAVISAVRHRRTGHRFLMAVSLAKAVTFAVCGGLGLFFLTRNMIRG